MTCKGRRWQMGKGKHDKACFYVGKWPMDKNIGDEPIKWLILK
jgi:hypothetical protein